MPATQAGFTALIRTHSLSHLADRIMARAKPSIRLLASETAAASGSCSFGGGSALLPTPAWPASPERPLQLLAQIDLANLPKVARDLPPSGWLSFFYDAERMSDFTDGDPTGWSVLYTPDQSAACQVTSPVPALPVRPLRLVEDLTLPTVRSIDMTEMDLSDEDRRRYWGLAAAATDLASPGEPFVHRMLGHPDGIQGCMQRTLQFETRGLELPKGIYSWYEHPRAAELMPGAHDWRLLLQIDTDPNEFGVYWGDADGFISGFTATTWPRGASSVLGWCSSATERTCAPGGRAYSSESVSMRSAS